MKTFNELLEELEIAEALQLEDKYDKTLNEDLAPTGATLTTPEDVDNWINTLLDD